jgi:hypothetical protein
VDGTGKLGRSAALVTQMRLAALGFGLGFVLGFLLLFGSAHFRTFFLLVSVSGLQEDLRCRPT